MYCILNLNMERPLSIWRFIYFENNIFTFLPSLPFPPPLSSLKKKKKKKKRLEKSRLDGYTEVSAYNPRNFAGIHSAIRTICDIKFKKEGEEKQRDEYSWGEEEKEEEEEGGEEGEERWGEEEGLEGRKVLGVVHEDEVFFFVLFCFVLFCFVVSFFI